MMYIYMFENSFENWNILIQQNDMIEVIKNFI